MSFIRKFSACIIQTTDLKKLTFVHPTTENDNFTRPLNLIFFVRSDISIA